MAGISNPTQSIFLVGEKYKFSFSPKTFNLITKINWKTVQWRNLFLPNYFYRNRTIHGEHGNNSSSRGRVQSKQFNCTGPGSMYKIFHFVEVLYTFCLRFYSYCTPATRLICQNKYRIGFSPCSQPAVLGLCGFSSPWICSKCTKGKRALCVY